jgi:integrase/recombinase XerD
MPPISLANLYHGPFSTLCVGFVNYKRSLGRKYTVEALGLKRFDQFTLVAGYKTNLLSKELVEQFIELRPTETPRNRELRRLLMKQFAVYLISLGYPAYFPPGDKRSRTTRYTAYIFTDAELSNFFKTLDNLEPMVNSPYMHLVLPVLFRFLYCCGLRISEALNLKMADVDLTEGLLTIRHSKNDQMRLIPLSSSLRDLSMRYAQQLHPNKCPNAYFFPAHDQTPLIRQDIVYHFRKLLWKSGIPYRGKGIGPRIHDFRHTFSVHSLRKSIAEGRDIYTTLPILSVFLGHQSLGATEVYLRLTAESFPGILQLVEKQSDRIFPQGEA